MPGPWVSPSDLRDALAADLHVPVGELVAAWENVLPRARESGHLDCLHALTARGYTVAQIDQWDRRAEYNREQGLYWALLYGASLTGFDVGVIKLRDRREELKAALVTVGGVPTFPPTGADGSGGLSIAGGRLDTGYYRFDMLTDF